MGKRKPYSLAGGRPADPHSAGRNAPVVTLRLDAETEAALLAMGGTTPALAREAIVGWVRSRHPGEYDAALARVRKRREREAS